MTSRRKPVPSEWRDQNHRLNLTSRRRYAARGDGRLADRAGGVCSCGARFGLRADPPRHNMNAADVRDAYADHVAEAFHGADYWVGSES
jgi:hypothetical protein